MYIILYDIKSIINRVVVEDDDNNNNNANGYGGAEKEELLYIQSPIKQGTTTRGVN